MPGLGLLQKNTDNTDWKRHGQVSAAMAIPMFIPYMGVYIGSILLVINTLMQILAPAVDVAEGSAE